MVRLTRHLASALLVLALAGCYSTRAPDLSGAPDVPAAHDAPAAARLAEAAWTVCGIDAAASLLDVRVFRTGRLARLGHNHVLSTGAIGGWIALRDATVAADLFVSPAAFVIDDPDLRAAAGNEFATTPSDSDRAGTRANLLGDRVLDTAAHPFLTVRIDAATLSRGPVLPARIGVAGVTVDRDLALDTFDNGVATGRFDLTHDELGLAPFTALGGALAVADTIEVRYRLALMGDPACASAAMPAFTR